MQELIAQLLRLYLPAGADPDALARHVDGSAARPIALASGGATRALVIGFERRAGALDPWEALCLLANALQGELGWPAPAVSISGHAGFKLWLSFAQPLALAEADALRDRLVAAYCADAHIAAGGAADPVALPPCLHPESGKWAAFIHPGMGASFSDEPGLEVAPPPVAQAAFLEGLESIAPDAVRHALARLGVAARAVVPAAPAPPPSADGLLLKDATLEDIVRHLHARNIEPTFRHLIAPREGAGK